MEQIGVIAFRGKIFYNPVVNLFDRKETPTLNES